MQRVVNAETKIGLRSSTMVWDWNVYCSKSHRLSYNTSLKVLTQSSNNKDSSRSEKLKPRDSKPAISYNNAMAEPAKKKNRKDKKKRFRGQKWEYIGEWKEQIPTTNINVTKVIPKKKRKVRYFNCDKKSHYTNNYTKP